MHLEEKKFASRFLLLRVDLQELLELYAFILRGMS